MRFLIPAGHEGTTGAVSGKLIEEVLTEQLAEKIAKILREQGHEAIEPNFNLFDEVSKATWPAYLAGFDYVLEVHFNATPGASGTEIYVASGTASIGVEKAIMQRLGKWFKLRDPDGVKIGPFKTIKRFVDKGALLEVAFIDNTSEMAKYLFNTDTIARDIAYGILEGFGVTIKTTPIKVPEVKQDHVNGPYTNPEGQQLWFRAIEGSYETREPAQTAVDRMIKEGRKAWLLSLYLPKK